MKVEQSNVNQYDTLFKSYEKKYAHLDKSVFFSSKAEAIYSILVRTGVFQGDIKEIENHNSQLVLAHKDMIVEPSLIKPSYVLDDVFEAVKLIFSQENV